uniref:PRC-barrel domain-containing protein n=1 Tax=Chamaesiphon sp. OTE_20_metabat_361 TaxID=2964689 RepID=UPI00286CB021
MALHKIKDFDPEYSKHFDDRDVKGMDLYVSDEKIGSVDDILVDDDGQFRYLAISTGGWISGKTVLLPIGRAQIDYDKKRVYAQNLTKAQVEALPELTEETSVDYDHEESVRGVYRSTMPGATATAPEMGVGYTSATMPASTHDEPMLGVEDEYLEPQGAMKYDRDTYSHDREPDLYEMKEDTHPSFKLYQERLVASKTRQKTGNAVINKRVETET